MNNFAPGERLILLINASTVKITIQFVTNPKRNWTTNAVIFPDIFSADKSAIAPKTKSTGNPRIKILITKMINDQID